MEAGGVMPCILNAANEEANLLFRKEKISFLQIAELNEKAMQNISNQQKPDLEMLLEADRKAREFVWSYV
jgi:1-deoxy-D-xylulose-5-phosphate reductoisomerase